MSSPWFILALSPSLLFSLETARAASFECGKAITIVEKAICKDTNLSMFEEDMADYYNKVLQRSDSTQKANIAKDQRAWLKKRDECQNMKGRDEVNTAEAIRYCLEYEILARLKSLRETLDSMEESAVPADALAYCDCLKLSQLQSAIVNGQQANARVLGYYNPVILQNAITAREKFIYAMAQIIHKNKWHESDLPDCEKSVPARLLTGKYCHNLLIQFPWKN